jgi:hypothetical protein
MPAVERRFVDQHAFDPVLVCKELQSTTSTIPIMVCAMRPLMYRTVPRPPQWHGIW